MKLRRRRLSTIQNEEVLPEVLKGESFFIPCFNEKDAHSKRVSLNNAKMNGFPPWEQKKIKIQKVEINKKWGVKVFPAAKTTIMKIVGDEMVPWSSEEEDEEVVGDVLSKGDKRMISLMLRDKKSTEEIVSTVGEEKKELIQAEIIIYTGVPI